jgi:predicted transcriptional regulator
MNLRRFFEETGIKQVAFAKKVGISTTCLQNYLSGSIPTLDRALRIEKASNGMVKAEAEDWNINLNGSAKKSTNNKKSPQKNVKVHKSMSKPPRQKQKES